jgi:protein gp37
MGQLSSIEWTEATWNPVTGCSKISPGCKNCYAERLANRLAAMGQYRYRNGFDVTLQYDLIDLPLRWRQPRMIFVNSMSDLFHEDVPESFIKRVFETMTTANRHTFQILTKRSERLAQLAPYLTWPENIWMGVSVESPRYVARIADLCKVPAAVRFLSVEPLLEPIANLGLDGIDWVIVGGESGPGCRPMKAEWARQILKQCKKKSVPFFFKQWGGIRKKSTGRLLDGRTWDEFPQPQLRQNSKTPNIFRDLTSLDEHILVPLTVDR